MSDLVSIIIPAFNQLEYCRQCVSSILAGTTWPYKLVLVDNGSTDGAGAFFDSVPGATVVHTGSNLGFAGGVNAGLGHAEGHVLLLNSDTIVPRQWLNRLMDVLLADSRRGAVGPVSNCVSGPQQIESPEFDSMDAINTFADARHSTHGMTVRVTQRLVGFCMLIREETYRDVGRMDERFGTGNFEDDDYCLRILQTGRQCCIADGCFVFHYGSRTFQAMGLTGEKFNQLCDANLAKFTEKWGRSDMATASEALVAAARQSYAAGDLTDAIRLMKDAIALGPGVSQHYVALGDMLWHSGHRGRALVYLAKAASLDPSNQELARRLAAASEELDLPTHGGCIE